MGAMTSSQAFAGVEITPLKQIETAGGPVYHGLKKSESSFQGFGEAYFSFVNQGAQKGWKKHLRMTLNFVVPVGHIEFTLRDDREGSSTREQTFKITLGKNNYRRLTIPPGIWVAFKGLDTSNLVMNLANLEHDPQEAINTDLSEFPLN